MKIFSLIFSAVILIVLLVVPILMGVLTFHPQKILNTLWFKPIIISLAAVQLAFLLFSVLRWLVDKANHFIPKVKLSVSTDAGKTYNEYTKAIPIAKNFYVKYEIEVKANGFWRIFLGNKIHFSIKYPENFYITYEGREIRYHGIICDYTGYVDKTSKEQDSTQKEKEFVAIASRKPWKAEILLKFSYQGCNETVNTENTELWLSFGDGVHKAYQKTTTLGFVDYFGRIL